MLAEVEINTVPLNYLKALLGVGFNFAIAYAVVRVVGAKRPKLLRDRHRLVCVVVGTGLLLVAGIGRLGWPIQTWGGVSDAENLNNQVFLILSHLGTFLLFLDIVFLLVNKPTIPESRLHTSQRLLSTRTYLTIGACVMLSVAVIFGVVKNYQPMWMGFLSCGALLVFGNLDKLKWFKVGKSGLEAETRAVVNEAKGTIKEIQALSKITATSTLGLVKKNRTLGWVFI